MLHGFPQNLTMWAGVAPLLAAAGLTTICADLREYGNSAKSHCLADRLNYAFRAMAADQAALMNQLGFPRSHMSGMTPAGAPDFGWRSAKHWTHLRTPNTIKSETISPEEIPRPHQQNWDY